MGHYHYHHLLLVLIALVSRGAVLGHPLNSEDATQQQQQQQKESLVKVGKSIVPEDLR